MRPFFNGTVLVAPTRACWEATTIRTPLSMAQSSVFDLIDNLFLADTSSRVAMDVSTAPEI